MTPLYSRWDNREWASRSFGRDPIKLDWETRGAERGPREIWETRAERNYLIPYLGNEEVVENWEAELVFWKLIEWQMFQTREVRDGSEALAGTTPFKASQQFHVRNLIIWRVRILHAGILPTPSCGETGKPEPIVLKWRTDIWKTDERPDSRKWSLIKEKARPITLLIPPNI